MKNAHNEQTSPSQYLNTALALFVYSALFFIHDICLYINVGRGLAPAVFYEREKYYE